MKDLNIVTLVGRLTRDAEAPAGNGLTRLSIAVNRTRKDGDQFGDEAKKSTCLWLQGLPPLVADRIVGQGKVHVTKSGRKLPEWYNLPPSPDRAKLRSITFPGLARAMAEQWG